MKRLFALFLCLILALPLLASCSKTDKPDIILPDTDYIWCENADGVTLIFYKGEETTVNVPSEIEGKPVTELGPECFLRAPATTIVIPEGIKRIGSFAFRTCTALSSLVIPSSVEFIGTNAFNDTPWYKTCTDEFTVVGDGVLIKYTGTSEAIDIPSEVKCIACRLGQDDVTVTDIKIPDSVKYICGDAFVKTDWRRSLSDEFTIIGDGILIKYAGEGGEVVIPDTVKTISGAFIDSTKVTSVKISSSVTRIESYSFACISGFSDTSAPNTISHLKSIEIPDSVNYIGNSAFFNCSELESITLPSSLAFVDCQLLTYCANIKNVVIPENAVTVGYGAFAESGVETVDFGKSLKFIGDFAFLNDFSITKAELPDSLEVIATYGFTACQTLCEVTLPDNLYFAADSAFQLCADNLTFTVKAETYAEEYCKTNELTYKTK